MNWVTEVKVAWDHLAARNKVHSNNGSEKKGILEEWYSEKKELCTVVSETDDICNKMKNVWWTDQLVSKSRALSSKGRKGRVRRQAHLWTVTRWSVFVNGSMSARLSKCIP